MNHSDQLAPWIPTSEINRILPQPAVYKSYLTATIDQLKDLLDTQNNANQVGFAHVGGEALSIDNSGNFVDPKINPEAMEFLSFYQQILNSLIIADSALGKTLVDELTKHINEVRTTYLAETGGLNVGIEVCAQIISTETAHLDRNEFSPATPPLDIQVLLTTKDGNLVNQYYRRIYNLPADDNSSITTAESAVLDDFPDQDIYGYGGADVYGDLEDGFDEDASADGAQSVYGNLSPHEPDGEIVTDETLEDYLVDGEFYPENFLNHCATALAINDLGRMLELAEDFAMLPAEMMLRGDFRETLIDMFAELDGEPLFMSELEESMTRLWAILRRETDDSYFDYDELKKIILFDIYSPNGLEDNIAAEALSIIFEQDHTKNDWLPLALNTALKLKANIVQKPYDFEYYAQLEVIIAHTKEIQWKKLDSEMKNCLACLVSLLELPGYHKLVAADTDRTCEEDIELYRLDQMPPEVSALLSPLMERSAFEILELAYLINHGTGAQADYQDYNILDPIQRLVQTVKAYHADPDAFAELYRYYMLQPGEFADIENGLIDEDENPKHSLPPEQLKSLIWDEITDRCLELLALASYTNQQSAFDHLLRFTKNNAYRIYFLDILTGLWSIADSRVNHDLGRTLMDNLLNMPSDIGLYPRLVLLELQSRLQRSKENLKTSA